MMKLLGALAACILTITIPSFYYFFSVSEMRNSLMIETAYLAKTVEQVIQARPDMWEFETVRLQEIISQPELTGDRYPHEKVIRNGAGTVIAKTAIATRRPVI